MKKIMLLGGSVALGSYLTPEHLNMGYQVHVVSLDTLHSNDPKLTYETANVKDDAWTNTPRRGSLLYRIRSHPL